MNATCDKCKRPMEPVKGGAAYVHATTDEAFACGAFRSPRPVFAHKTGCPNCGVIDGHVRGCGSARPFRTEWDER